MTTRLLTALALISLAGAPALAAGNVNFNIGTRFMSDGAWDDLDLDPQLGGGVTVDFGADGSTFHVALGLHTSVAAGESDVVVDGFRFRKQDTSAAIVDLSVGALWLPGRESRVQPYLGGGVASVGVGVKVEDEDDTDRAFGYYVNGGVYWRVGPRVNIGVDARFLKTGDLEFDVREYLIGKSFRVEQRRVTVDADSIQLSFVIGFGWPGR